MRRYTEVSNVYEGTELSFFFIEGERDYFLNRYVRGHLKKIKQHLADHGVRNAGFHIVSDSFWGAHSIRNLILRRCPTLDKKGVNELIKKFKNEHQKSTQSRLLYIADITLTDNYEYVADILCEDDFERDGDCIATLYKFFDNAVRCNIQREKALTERFYKEFISLSKIKYKLPSAERPECVWDNSEFLGCDLLAEKIVPGKSVEVSPIRFDSKFNIILPLYPQIKIKLDPLPKSLYILILQHPEGIVLKEIQEYANELKSIYCAVSGRKNPTVVNRMLKALTDPTENPLHKNLSIIRHCFMSKLRFDLAQNYIPAHGRSKAHNIPIDCQLVEIPEIA